MAKKLLIRAVSATLSTAFFLTNAAAPYAQEQSFWESRRSASQFARRTEEPAPLSGRALLSQMPPAAKVPMAAHAPTAARFDWLSRAAAAHGLVRETYISPNADAPLVVHIQDAHGIEEAQRNIAALIQIVTDQGPAGAVAVEGASGHFRLEAYREGSPEVTKEIADVFLAKGLIAGPEYAGLTAPQTIDFQGAEDDSLYADNLAALKEAHRRREALEPVLAGLRAETDRLMNLHFSPALKNLDQMNKSYEAGQGLGKYVEGLAAVAEPAKDLINVRALRVALKLETALNFKEVEAERRGLVEKLVARLDKEDLESLVAKSVDHRAGRLGFSEYHRHLAALCAKAGAPVAPSSPLGRYITYLTAAEKVNANGLLTEMGPLENAAWRKLAQTPVQAGLVEARTHLALLDKLVHHQMGLTDWNAYDAQRAKVLDLPRTLARAGGKAPRGFTADELKPFEDFWTVALHRNDAFIKNTLARANAKKGAVLVAGGFHTPGLAELLRKKQISYVVLSPRFTAPTAEDQYLDLIATDAPPLERLLAADRLTLVKPLELPKAQSVTAQTFLGIKKVRATGQPAALPQGAEARPCDDVHADDVHAAGVDIFKGPGRNQRGALSPDFLRALGRLLTAPVRAVRAMFPRQEPRPPAPPPPPLSTYWAAEPLISARHDHNIPVDRYMAPRLKTIREEILSQPNRLLTRAYSGRTSAGPVSGLHSSRTHWQVLPIANQGPMLAALRDGDIDNPAVQDALEYQLRRYLAADEGEIWITTLHDLVRENPVSQARVDNLGDAVVHFTELDMPLNGVHVAPFKLKEGVSFEGKRALRTEPRIDKIPADVDFFEWRLSERITALLAEEAAQGRGLQNLSVFLTVSEDGRGVERLDIVREPNFRYSPETDAYVSQDLSGHRTIRTLEQFKRTFRVELETGETEGLWKAGRTEVYDTRLTNHVMMRGGPLPDGGDKTARLTLGWLNQSLVAAVLWAGQRLDGSSRPPASWSRALKLAEGVVRRPAYSRYAAPITEAWGLPGLALALMPLDPTGFVALPLASLIFTTLHGADAPAGRKFQFFAVRFAGALAVNLAAVHLGTFLLATEMLDSAFWTSLGASFLIGAIGHSLYNLLAPSLRLPALTIGNGAPAASLTPAGLVEELEALTSSPKEVDWERVESLAAALEAAVPEAAIIEHLNRLSPNGESLKNFNASNPNPLVHRIVAFHERVELTVMKDQALAGGDYADAFPDAHGRALKLEALLTAVEARRQGVELDWRDFYYARPADNVGVMRDVSPSAQGLRELNTLQLNDDATYTPQDRNIEQAIAFFAKNGFVEGNLKTELYPLLIRSKLAMRKTLADLKGTKLERLLGETRLTFLLLRVFAIFRNHPARFAGLPYADLTKSVLGVMSGIERSIEGGPDTWPLLYHRDGDVVAVPMGDELIKLGRNMDGHENRLLERFVLAEAVAAPATKTVDNLLEDLRGAWKNGDEKGAQLAVKSLIDADSPAVLGALSRAMRNGNTTEIEDPEEFVFATGIRRLINNELPRQPSSALKRLFVRSALTKPGEELFPDDQLDGLFSPERFHEFAERFAQGIGNQARRGYPVSLVADVPNKDLFFEEVNGRMHPRPEFSARLHDGLGRQKTRLLDDIQYDLRYRLGLLSQVSEGLMKNFENQLLDAYIDALDKFQDDPRAAAAIAQILEKAWSRDFPAKEEKTAQVLTALRKVYQHPDAPTSRKALNALLFAVLPSAGDQLDPTLDWLGRTLVDWEITMGPDRAKYESVKTQLNKLQEEAEGWEKKEIVAKQREAAEIGVGLTRRGEEILGVAKGLGSLMAEGSPIANRVMDHVLRLISNERTGPHLLGELLPLVSPALTSTRVAETVLQAAGWGDNLVLREALADGAKDPTTILADNALDLRARILVLAHHSQNEALLKSLIDNPEASPALRLYAFARWGENFLFKGSREEDFTLEPDAASVMSGFAEKLRQSAAEVITDAQTNPARIQSLFSNPVLADEELKILLLAEFLDARDVMQAETPAVMAEALRLVAQAHRDDFSSSAHSGLRFGGLLFSHAEQPADLFFGVAAHEWFHVVLKKEHGFSSETRTGGILHEFGADVIAYARVRARGRDTKDFLRETNSIWSLGEEDSLDVHSVARKQLMSLLLRSVAAQESINAAGLSDAVITTLREEGVETRTTRDLFWRILMRHLYPGADIPPAQPGEGEVIGVIELILLEHSAPAGNPGPAKGKAFGLGQHAAALATALALGVAAYVAPGQFPMAEELSRILQAVGLALSIVWSFAIGLPAALNVAARALSPREPTLDFKTALWVDKWAQKNGAGMDWQNSPANGWTAETLRGPRGAVTVRIAPWLTARSESAIYNQLRGLLLRMVLTHEEWRIQGVSTTAIFLNKPFSLFRTLQTPRLPQALQPQDYTVAAWQAKVATVDGRWNIRFFSDQSDKPLFIDRFSDLTPTALAQLISVYNNVKVSADDIAGEINVVFHAKGSRRHVYLADVRLKDGRAFPLALVVADQDPRKVYFDEFVDGPTYRQLADGGRLTAAQRAAAVRELLQKARGLNGGLPMDFNLNNLIYNHRRAEAVMVDIDSAPLYILDRRNDANPAAPIPAHPNNHYLFLGLLYAQLGRLDAPGDNRVLLATIEETLGTTGRKILENAFAKAQAMDAVETRTNFLRRREAMFREMGTGQAAFDALHARMSADLKAYLSAEPAQTDSRPGAGRPGPFSLKTAARPEGVVGLSQGAVLEVSLQSLSNELTKSLLGGRAQRVTETLRPERIPDLGVYWPTQPKNLAELLQEAAETPLTDARPSDDANTRNTFTVAAELAATAFTEPPAERKTWMPALKADWVRDAFRALGQRMAGQSTETLPLSLAGSDESAEAQAKLFKMRRMADGFLERVKGAGKNATLVLIAENRAQAERLGVNLSDPRVKVLVPAGTGTNTTALSGLLAAEGQVQKVDMDVVNGWLGRQKLSAATYLVAYDETRLTNLGNLIVIAIEKVTETVEKQVDVMMAVLTQA